MPLRRPFEIPGLSATYLDMLSIGRLGSDADPSACDLEVVASGVEDYVRVGEGTDLAGTPALRGELWAA